MSDLRLQQYLERVGGDGLATAEPGLVRMLTGFAVDVNVGVTPFQLPAIVVAPNDGPAQLVCAADQTSDPEHVHTYEGFTVGAIDPLRGALSAFREAIKAAGLTKRRVVVDAATIPIGFQAAMPPSVTTADRLLELGAVKSAEEIAAVERSISLCDVGQFVARQTTSRDTSELSIWTAVAEAMERAVGSRIMILSDLVSGSRTAVGGGAPSARPLAAGSVVLCDLAPRLDGMWGDSCATWAVGEPPDWAGALHIAALESLQVGLSLLKPGTRAGDVDAAMRSVVADAGYGYPHHSGHGIGFRPHEEPRIIPGGATVLEAGMIVALEPGGYLEHGGLRVEQVAVVGDAGGRVLSQHSLDLT